MKESKACFAVNKRSPKLALSVTAVKYKIKKRSFGEVGRGSHRLDEFNKRIIRVTIKRR
jgi:hypothetical protein